MPSSGLHTNGYSLARRVLLDEAQLDLAAVPEGLEVPLADALLAPHRSYFHELWPLLADRRLHALVHITGGGFDDNIPRVLPASCDVVIDPSSWEIPPLFRLIQRCGEVAMAEMRRVFNLGIGMIAILDSADAPDFVRATHDARRIGTVVAGGRRVRFLD